jgi:DNA-binding LacI/PurR family transcriptional regulator
MPLTEMGAAAVESIDRVLRGETVGDVVIDVAPKLIERKSIAPPPA